MSIVDRLKKDFKKVAPGMLIHSEDGVGKTTLACSLPQSCIVHHPDEDGVGDLKTSGKIVEDYPVFEVSTWKDALELIEYFIEESPFKAVSFDTVNTLLQRLCFEYVSEEHFESKWEDFQSWDKGVKRAVPEWEGLLHSLTRLRRSGTLVLLLSHTKKTDFRNPEGQNYMRYQPDLYESTRSDGPSILAPTKRWATDIGYMDYVVNDIERGKAKGGRSRRLRFVHEAAIDAKNRAGIVDPIDLGYTPTEAYQAFVKAFQQRKGEGQ